MLAGLEGLLLRQTDTPPAAGEVRRRLNEALHLAAYTTDGEPLGQVLDVRLVRLDGATMRLEAQGLVIGRGRPGSYLGYDRDGKQGPWLLNRLVRWIHRHLRVRRDVRRGERRLGWSLRRGGRHPPTARPLLIDPPSGCGRARRGRVRKVG